MTTKSRLLLDTPPLTLQKELACALGSVNLAIVIQQLHYLLVISQERGESANDDYKFRNGRWWVYNSYAQWKRDHFPFWEESKIGRLFRDLEKRGLITSMQFGSEKWDQRKWYAINYGELDKLCTMDSDKNERSMSTKVDDGELQDCTIMSETTTETTTETTIPAAPVNFQDDKRPYRCDHSTEECGSNQCPCAIPHFHGAACLVKLCAEREAIPVCEPIPEDVRMLDAFHLGEERKKKPPQSPPAGNWAKPVSAGGADSRAEQLARLILAHNGQGTLESLEESLEIRSPGKKRKERTKREALVNAMSEILRGCGQVTKEQLDLSWEYYLAQHGWKGQINVHSAAFVQNIQLAIDAVLNDPERVKSRKEQSNGSRPTSRTIEPDSPGLGTQISQALGAIPRVGGRTPGA